MTDETLENISLPGSRLREQRERKGLSVAQAASELHVNCRLLEALEEDRFDDIGAPIFVKGHLRNYARLLGLDPNELVAEYEAANRPAEPTLVAHRPDGPRMEPGRSQAWVGWLGWLFLLVLAVLLGGWWYYEQEGGGELPLESASESVSIIPRPDDGGDREIRPQTDMTLPQETLAGGGEDEGAAEPQAETETGGPPEVVMPASPVETPAQTQSPVQRPAERAAPPAEGQGLVLQFTEESWVEIYDDAGRPILYDLMKPGTRREINASGQLRVFLGNADGVTVSVAGEPFDVERYRRGDSTARFNVNVPSAD